MPVSDVSNCADAAFITTVPTPVLKGYLPVNILALVGEQTGLPNALVNLIPFEIIALIFGAVAVSVVVLKNPK